MEPDKEQPKWNEEEWGKQQFREFDKCPTCGCPNRFGMEAMRGEFPEDRMKEKPPAMGAFQFNFETTLHRITLDVVVDSCCKCGTIYTIARSKRKTSIVGLPTLNRGQRRHPGPGMPPGFGRG